MEVPQDTGLHLGVQRCIRALRRRLAEPHLWTGGYTAPLTGGTVGTGPSDEGQTIAVIHQQLGIDPVVGWLVAVSGSERGRDYRIHSDNNYIGRSEKMAICIRGDDTISRVNHAVIAYDTRERLFYFAPGEGRSINRINGKATLGMVELHPYDRAGNWYHKADVYTILWGKV